MAVSETLTAESADDEERRRRGSSGSSASSEAASSESYCPPDEWQQAVAIKTCVTDDATGKAKPPDAKEKLPGAEKHRAPGSCVVVHDKLSVQSQSSTPVSLTVGIKLAELELMKERFAKLLLGEDMSGSGKGVCTALAISNAITNLCGEPPLGFIRGGNKVHVHCQH